MNRRQFMASSTAAVAGMGLFKSSNASSLMALSKSALLNNLGIQLYTLRDAIVKDPMGTLKAVKDDGYKQVELADINHMAQLQPALKDLKLAVNSSHFPNAYLTGDWAVYESMGAKVPEKKDFPHVIELATKYNLKYVVYPYIFPQERGGLDVYKKLVENLNKAGEQCKKAGISLCYHHHAFEFQPMDGTSPIQILMQQSDPDLLGFETDVFWLSVAGVDPAAFIKQHAGRIKMVHLKDKKKGTSKVYNESIPEDSFQPVGSGSIDFAAILEAADEAKVTYAFVEQDQSSNPMADIKKSIQYLDNMA